MRAAPRRPLGEALPDFRPSHETFDTSTEMTISIAGAGHMGGAILRGLASSPERPALRVFDADPARAAALAAETGAEASPGAAECAAGADAVVAAVRPADMPALLAALSPAVSPEGPLVLSIAAGRTTAWIEGLLPAGARVVRAMPNLGASVGLAATAFSLGARATRADAALAHAVLSGFGLAVELPEKDIDAVTALSGSGPAFFASALQSLAEGGAALGLPPETARALAVQTMLGTATVLSRRGAPAPGKFVESVATPGGTTAAGMAVLGASDAKAVFAATLAAAARRAGELASS